MVAQAPFAIMFCNAIMDPWSTAYLAKELHWVEYYLIGKHPVITMHVNKLVGCVSLAHDSIRTSIIKAPILDFRMLKENLEDNLVLEGREISSAHSHLH